MSDTVKADLERFPQAAHQWDLLSSTLKGAHDTISVGEGQGWRFGILAEGSVDQAHDKVIASLIVALTGGVTATTGIGNALRAVARDFGLTDAEQARILKNTTIELEP